MRTSYAKRAIYKTTARADGGRFARTVKSHMWQAVDPERESDIKTKGEYLMARKIFSSFHYKPDNWRAATVRSIGAIEGNKLASDNDWESVTSGGDAAIKRWINEQMHGKSCVIVLIGSKTAGRKWINYEIKKGWEDKKGIFGIHIHKLKDSKGNQSTKGNNPFDKFTIGEDKKKFSSIVKTYDPPGRTSEDVYNYIRYSIVDWIEEAIRIRNNY